MGFFSALTEITPLKSFSACPRFIGWAEPGSASTRQPIEQIFGLLCFRIFGAILLAFVTNAHHMVYRTAFYGLLQKCKVNGTGLALNGDQNYCNTCIYYYRVTREVGRGFEFLSTSDYGGSPTDAKCKSNEAEGLILRDFLTKVDPTALEYLIGLDEEACELTDRVDLHGLTVANEIVKAYCMPLITPSPTPSASPKTLGTLAPRVRICVKDLRMCLRGTHGRSLCCSNLCKCLKENEESLLKKPCAQLCKSFSPF